MVHTSLCFVTGYDGCHDMCRSVYAMHSLFCQTVTDDDGAYICVDGSVCVVYLLVSSHSQEKQLLSV